MYFSLIALALAAVLQPARFNRIESLFEPPMIGLPQAVSTPRYWEMPIEVCGRVAARTLPDRPGISVLSGGNHWLFVKTKNEALPERAACVRGVVLRRDGYTEAAAERLGLVRATMIDVPDDLRILHECSSDDECAVLVRQLKP